jgi:hypothetical protein
MLYYEKVNVHRHVYKYITHFFLFLVLIHQRAKSFKTNICLLNTTSSTVEIATALCQQRPAIYEQIDWMQSLVVIAHAHSPRFCSSLSSSHQFF